MLDRTRTDAWNSRVVVYPDEVNKVLDRESATVTVIDSRDATYKRLMYLRDHVPHNIPPQADNTRVYPASKVDAIQVFAFS